MSTALLVQTKEMRRFVYNHCFPGKNCVHRIVQTGVTCLSYGHLTHFYVFCQICGELRLKMTLHAHPALTEVTLISAVFPSVK